jgi:glutamate synthase domain-containing protein 3
MRTGSLVGRNLLASWERARDRFVKVMPRDYRRALAERAAREEPLEASGASAGGD